MPYPRAIKTATKRTRNRLLRSAKLTAGCIDCGYAVHPNALDFDHVRGEKSYAVSRLLKDGASWERIWTELDKCDVRCANCHRSRSDTYGIEG